MSSLTNKAHFESEKEAIHMILTGIGDEIYSTVDACNTTHEMWEAIKRLQQGYKLMNEMIRNNLTVDKMQVNVQFLQQLQPEWSRFVTIVKQQHKLDEVSYHKFFDILKQYQKEVNELRAERIAKNANPLALLYGKDPGVETVDSNVIPDSPDMCDNDIQNDQNVVECDDERVALANLTANLKLDVDENKKIQKQMHH
ncbi:hypothetical protein Tco_0556563 [Tanacetum coccineum]